MDMLFYTEWLKILSDEVDLSRDLNVRIMQISSLGEGVPGRLEQQPQRPWGRSPRGLSVNNVQLERRAIDEPRGESGTRLGRFLGEEGSQ